MQPPFAGGFLFFVIFNSIIEIILFPLLLHFYWDHSLSNRFLSVTSGALYYGCRAWTYTYFVPSIFKASCFTTITPNNFTFAKDRFHRQIPLHQYFNRAVLNIFIYLLNNDHPNSNSNNIISFSSSLLSHKKMCLTDSLALHCLTKQLLGFSSVGFDALQIWLYL